MLCSECPGALLVSQRGDARRCPQDGKIRYGLAPIVCDTGSWRRKNIIAAVS